MKESLITQTAILERMLQPNQGGWSVPAAEAILCLSFQKKDVQQMKRLLAKAEAGALSTDDEIAFENYRNVGRFLELMKSRARRTLNQKRS